MDLPAGIVKVGKESGQHFENKYEDGGNAARKLARRVCSASFPHRNISNGQEFVNVCNNVPFSQNIRESVGMPIGVQIVGKPFQEELVLRAMVELENQIGG